MGLSGFIKIKDCLTPRGVVIVSKVVAASADTALAVTKAAATTTQDQCLRIAPSLAF
jgi:hypothetical protein